MAHEVETAVFAGNLPAWHRLGTVVPQDVMTAAEAIELAGLDWTVELRPVYSRTETFDAFTGNASWKYEPIEGKYAVTRTTDNKALGVVGRRYRPIQNKEAFDFIDALVDSGDAKYDTAGSLAGGKRTFLIAKTNKDFLVGGEPSEQIARYLFFRNTHDGTSSVEALLTDIRVVCANTENWALAAAKASYRIRHTANWQTKVREAREVLQISFAHNEAFEALANEMITTPFTHGQELDSFLRRLIPFPANQSTDRQIATKQQARDDIKTLLLNEPNLQNINKTTWGALNAVTQWADWSRKVKGNGENRLNRILEDTEIKTRALELLTVQPF